MSCLHLFATVYLRILKIFKAILYLYFTTQKQSLYFFLHYICLTALVTTQVIFLVTVALLMAWSLIGFYYHCMDKNLTGVLASVSRNVLSSCVI